MASSAPPPSAGPLIPAMEKRGSPRRRVSVCCMRTEKVRPAEGVRRCDFAAERSGKVGRYELRLRMFEHD